MKQLLLLIMAFFMALPSTLAVPSTEQAAGSSASSNRQILVLLRQKPAHYRGDDGYGGGYGDARNKASREVIGQRLAKQHSVRFAGFWAMPEIGLDCLILEAAEGQSLDVVIAAIEQDKEVEWAEPVQTYEAMGSASYNDPLYPAAPAATQWHLAELHQTATGKGITVAVIDSSIDTSHPDLAGQVSISKNFVDGKTLSAETHGTAVAGVIAAKANNQQGMVGVAPKAKLLGLRACWQKGATSVCDSLSIAKALHYAIEQDADVLNLSLTGPSGKLLTELIDKAIANGSIVVAAIDSSKASGGFPASYKGVIGAADSASAASSFSGYQAPGKGVPTTQPNAKWYMVNGSSYSAAHISGLFALLLQKKGSGRPALVKSGSAVDARASLKKAAGG